MKQNNFIVLAGLIIALLSSIASVVGIFSVGGPGEFQYLSVRGEIVNIYGIGVYKHMSSDVAIQGIAQDYITLFIAIPLLLISLYFFNRNSFRARIILTGTIFYFLVTYLFYATMGAYNELFLIYLMILCLSFFSFIILLLGTSIEAVKKRFEKNQIIITSGYFLIINSLMVSSLWLGIIIPPLISGEIYPKELQHYTTLIVQGLDLGLLLPMGAVSGILAIKRNKYGYLFVPIYFIFLSILMLALISKIIFMAKEGVNVIPVIFIMPIIFLISLFFSVTILRKVKENS